VILKIVICCVVPLLNVHVILIVGLQVSKKLIEYQLNTWSQSDLSLAFALATKSLKTLINTRRKQITEMVIFSQSIKQYLFQLTTFVPKCTSEKNLMYTKSNDAKY